MKKIVLASSLFFVLAITSCGPAAEDRQAMHSRAKVFQDSIANVIRMSMAEAAAPGPNAAAVPAVTAAAQPAGAQPTSQPANPNSGVNKAK